MDLILLAYDVNITTLQCAYFFSVPVPVPISILILDLPTIYLYTSPNFSSHSHPTPLSITQVHTHPEHADAVHAIYEQTTRRAQSSAEPDVIHYCITRDPENPSIFHFFERYRNKEAFRVHNEQEIIQRLVGSGWIRDVEAVFGVPIG